MKNLVVSDIMTRDPITIGPETTLIECAKKMVQKRTGSLLITKNKVLIGFISQKDILWALTKKSKEDLSKIRAIEISTRKIATIRPDYPISEVIRKMKKVRFKKQLVGVITIKDILNFYPEVYPELEELKAIREEEEKLKRINKKGYVKEGICEQCGNYGILERVEGEFICESCKNFI
jgi:signal-transduction protein with cAMP-binding, CBS, and nucleotidyltransferase domain